MRNVTQQIGGKNHRTHQDTDEHRVFAFVVARNLRAKLGNALLNLLVGQQNRLNVGFRGPHIGRKLFGAKRMKHVR